ncbi:interactor of constitutive active ROPs 3-like isoform X2 [Carya illinoinensis]|uniref:interactor of constitutive active ROPs 3-like isoform X2 n=1 Tax=Carya illinoinensis TaxID=32201 RepID=UPI001C7182FE|nr:interactor of constitutive active ROPs 3-like isoform X2 [Carya illinoinensis]XP_042959722.1 interactor of constitutive active ROPs 3-like isoform X2 [Carya illinoinensis]XP_042959723.1 interactor of constitutive active ROPs 3-like isoform X2 [Carya illinoinensis]XP_042959724.1 interactor of constitutive active ROPs 3-like isoform X2 [Carya illinoinensis]XP_042959725.1 interactor of constitutive active ROPs 3-like isoform X2 [Carya illinoinensis]
MQTAKPSSSSEVPPKISSRVVRQLKPAALEIDSTSALTQTSRILKDRSPKVVERRSPRSPVSEKKRPSRISELESQVSQLREELKKTEDQLSLSESWKQQAQQDAEESKKQLLVLSSKLEESQQQLLQVSDSGEAHIFEHQKISQEQDPARLSELEAVLKQNSVESDALTSAINEIQQLKVQLEMVAESEATQPKQVELANAELQSLKGNLAETLSLVENMKNQLQDCKESEAQAEAMVMETLLQLETAKKTVEVLGSDRLKAIEAYNSIALELDQSKVRANLLEGLVRKLEADLKNASGDLYQNPSVEHSLELELLRTQEMRESMNIKAELHSLKPEVARLRSALESAETKYHEEQIRSAVQIRSAYELMEQIKSGSNLREAELEAELKNTKADVEELKSNLMDRETELQGVLEENEGLNSKLEKNLLYQKEYELEKDLKKLNEHIADLRANLMDKETELQSIMEENEMMKLEINKREMSRANVNDEVIAEVEAAKSAEREAFVKLGVVMEEADKSNRTAAMVTEQLEAAQSANSEMQGELRRLKVQSDQWRKAAEAAAAILSAGNNGKVMERTGSLDSNYNLVAGKFTSPYSEETEDDLLKKKNINMLKKIGVLWKKPQK